MAIPFLHKPITISQNCLFKFVKEDLFPRDWGYLNFDELKKNDTIENRNVIPGSGASADK